MLDVQGSRGTQTTASVDVLESQGLTEYLAQEQKTVE